MSALEDKYQHPEYLVETLQLQQMLSDPELRIFDCTVNASLNPDPEQAHKIPFVFKSGRSHYDKTHIPGAGFIDILGKLTDSTHEVPLMLPSKEQVVDILGACGIGGNTRVVLYSATETNWATRVWWILYALGFDNIAVLNGGWAKWVKEGRPVSNEACRYKSCEFKPQSHSAVFVDKNEVLAATMDDDALLINGLPFPVYAGTSDISFGRKGRITSSLNLPFPELHDSETGCYLSVKELNEKFKKLGTDNMGRIITYCGGGIAASNLAFSLCLLGYSNVAVYDGSMFEWGNDARLPMETGA